MRAEIWSVLLIAVFSLCKTIPFRLTSTCWVSEGIVIKDLILEYHCVVSYLSHPKSQTAETSHTSSFLSYPDLMILSCTLFSHIYLPSTEVLRIPNVEGFISALKELLSWKEKQTCCFLLLDKAPMLVTFHSLWYLLQHCQLSSTCVSSRKHCHVWFGSSRKSKCLWGDVCFQFLIFYFVAKRVFTCHPLFDWLPEEL